MSPLRFSCTLCGQCCHNHSLPLTMQEAIDWLADEGTVAIYCEGIRSPEDPIDARTLHRRKRGFAAPCGTSCLYVTAILVANISGPCKNLSEDMRCRIYERRPLVCRVYPAEISPFIELNPADKVCPPEAWTPAESLDNPFAELLPSLAEKSRQTDYREAASKGVVCMELGIHTTALAGEGYVRHLPEPQLLADALRHAQQMNAESLPSNPPWRLYSASLAQSESRFGLEVISEVPPGEGYQFLRA